MGFLSKLLRIQKQSEEYENNDSYSKEINKCMIECKITKSEYQLMATAYYKGYNSYRTFLKYVFTGKITKIKEVLLDAQKKAYGGCVIDFTFVRFIHSNNEYIDIPFEVFASKKDMSDRRLRTKIWHRTNIKRIIVTNPKLSQMSDEELEESLNDLITKILLKG